MFDLTSSKLLLVGIVALLVVGPKDLPVLLRTLGRYLGMVKRQAAEFRQQFDEAMRESELSELRKDVEDLGREAEDAMRDAERAAANDIDTADQTAKPDGPSENTPTQNTPELADASAASEASGFDEAGGEPMRPLRTDDPVAEAAAAAGSSTPDTHSSGTLKSGA